MSHRVPAREALCGLSLPYLKEEKCVLLHTHPIKTTWRTFAPHAVFDQGMINPHVGRSLLRGGPRKWNSSLGIGEALLSWLFRNPIRQTCPPKLWGGKLGCSSGWDVILWFPLEWLNLFDCRLLLAALGLASERPAENEMDIHVFTALFTAASVATGEVLPLSTHLGQ